MVIGFFVEDYVGISYPHTDALVLTLIVVNHNVYHILVDNGSSADVLYWSVFKKLNLGQEKIVPTSCLLMGFILEQVQSIGLIELPVIGSTYSRQATIMVQFFVGRLIVGQTTIIGRVALNELRAITSTLQLKMKFLTDHRVGEVRGNQ